MHICVIGAGVVGLTAAYFLQAEGHTVVVLDAADAPAAGASGASGAQLSYSDVGPLADASVPQRLLALLAARNAPLALRPRLNAAPWRWSLAYLRAANAATARATMAALLRLGALSREFIEPLIEGEGIACHFTRGGRVVVVPDAASLAAARAQVAYQATAGSVPQVLDAEACLAREPALAPYAAHIAGGVWTRSDAAADCGAYCRALAALLARRGVDFAWARRAAAFDVERGTVRALRMADGGSVRADAYVLAAGVDAVPLAATAGIVLPIAALKGYAITVRPLDAPVPRASICDARRRVVFAPLGDRVRVAGFVEPGGEATSIPPARIGALLAAAREVLGYHTVDGDLQPRAGLRPATPDGRPILGATPLANLFVNVGHGALGWTLAAGSARLVCDAIARRTPTIDAAPYALRAR